MPVIESSYDLWILQYSSDEPWSVWSDWLEKTLESPLDCKEIQPAHPTGDLSWVFIGGTDVEAETPILCQLLSLSHTQSYRHPLIECELLGGALPCSLLCPQHQHPLSAPQMSVIFMSGMHIWERLSSGPAGPHCPRVSWVWEALLIRTSLESGPKRQVAEGWLGGWVPKILFLRFLSEDKIRLCIIKPAFKMGWWASLVSQW